MSLMEDCVFLHEQLSEMGFHAMVAALECCNLVFVFPVLSGVFLDFLRKVRLKECQNEYH